MRRSAPGALQAIEVESGTGLEDDAPVKVEHFKCIGSYNWVDAPQPTILVPGAPPEWRDRPLPFRVPFDSGLQIFDPNGYYMGSASTLTPLFRAVDAVAEDNADTTMDWSAVDFVLDRSSLRKILRWVRSADTSWTTNWNKETKSNDSSARRHPDPASEMRQKPQKGAGGVPDFRLDLQLGGKKTVLMERWDTRTCQYVHPPKYGCRTNFDDAATSPKQGCRSSKYHNRIVQYDLEGVRLVVRFEVDACNPVDEDPSELLANLALSFASLPSTPSPPPDQSGTDITVLRGGIQTPQSSLIEIATRSPKGLATHKWYETYTQLFLSQTSHFYVAVHHNGLFTDLAKYRLASPKFERFERDPRMQRSLRQLVRVLGTIQRLVQEHGQRGRLSLVCRQGRLELFERDGDAGRLPDCELSRFGL
ncbi:hypothetical protein BV20DRAFT_1036524 [Pilatotrama ljubarskyi]|nr:hypothetical protein BV20DRAFT_1036524 [Pilatotrama ljubarskyi]